MGNDFDYDDTTGSVDLSGGEHALDEVSSGAKRPSLALISPLALCAILMFVAVVAVAYRFGDGVIFIGDRTISELSFVEVTGGAAVGIFGMIGGLGAALIGAVVAIVGAAIGVSVGLLGIALGAFIVVGFLTGPLLLIGVVVILIKRRYWPDVI